MKRKAASDEFLSAWKDLVSFADENPGVGMMLSEANRLYTFYRWPSRGDQQEAEGARADIVEELDRLIDARSQYEDDAELVALLEATRDAAQDDTLENALEDDPYKSVGTMKRKRSSRDLDSFFEEFDFDWDALAEEAGADAVVDSFGTGLAAAISERDGRKLRTATRMSSGTGRGLSEDLRNMLEEFDGWLAEEKSASRGVTTKAYAYQVFVVLDEEETAQAIIDLAAEYGGDEADSAGRTLKFEFDTQEASSAFREEVEPMEGVNSATQSIEGGKAASRGVTTKAAPSAEDFITRLGGAMYPIERDLEQHGDFAGGELMDATAALGQALVAADEGDWAKVAEHLDTAASALDADEVAEDGGLASTVTALDAFREEALGYAKETKSVSKLRTKYCDYPSYAGMPFGSPTLSTRYQDIPAAECKDLSYSVREAGEALEAASAIYLQRAAAAARSDDDSAPDVAAMNTLNGVAVQLETLADRLLAVGEGSSQYLSTGPGDTQCFYSWPDCLPSCLAAVEGALGSVSGDAEYLEVAAQLTVVRDMLRTLLTEDDTESEETTGLGEMKSYRTKGRLGRLSAVSDKVDYAVDALSGFSRGTDGVADALRILKDMRAAIEDGDRDAFGTALDELGGVRDEVDGDLDEGETGEFPYELAWLLSDLTDAYYGNKSARLETTKGHGMRKSYQTKRRSTMQDIYDGWSDVVDATTGIDAGVVQEIIGKLEVLVDVEPMNVQAVSDAIADAILNAGEYEDAEALVSALERFDNIVATYEDEPLRDGDGNYMGRSYNNMRTKKASRRSRFGDARNAMDTLGELSTQLDRVTDEAWTGRRRIVDSKARAALETAVAAASFVAESVRESVDTKAPLSAEQLADELSRASDALRVLEKSGDPWATTFRDDLSEFGSLLGRSASALDRYLDEKGEESGDEAGDSGAGKGKDDSRGSRLRRRQLAETRRSEADILRKASRAAQLAREVQGLERLLDGTDAGAVNDEAFARAVTKPASELAARRSARVRAY